MRIWAKPTQTEVDAFLTQERALDFTYTELEGTLADRLSRAGYDFHRNRILLGRGQAVFSVACAALARWEMFPQPWTEVHPANAEIRTGETVAVMIRFFGRWWLNSSRIVYRLDGTKHERRFGFAYGTLPGHVECGEEQFSIAWDKNDQVWYEIYSFSRPRFWLVRLAYPFARRLQKRFIRESLAQFQELVLDKRRPS